MPIARRTALLSGFNLLLGGGVAVLAAACSRAGAAPTAKEHFEVEMTDDQWKARLSPQAYAVLRHEGTETPFTSPLNNEHRKGTFTCAGCALALFASDTKFDSGTGWPSFWKPLPNAVNQRVDNSLGMSRDEVHCRRCGGHLGHVFDDGPKPTGLRYCMNGVAMAFTPA
ncbi:peptide-methionine (R)-S-oxide reductase MsrB [Scleromatobacter humisilvae]|uniref:peptide-methionine (R)-S-oxide reductase n=1 Tax=Scleromatobacter humisilvae TaxID=2897159 RepID=A0A9X1YGP1_9BURK|nr:peptide-methionine (R)-S-oxide reductase MsrB [Scleromatobacter humisilvae]MCK9686169.1 peptide-methionine (R)-S-oxide reductase MsrB [Scleromatobacter humisilvae]